jgi:phosphonate transport system ATP-binding protein
LPRQAPAASLRDATFTYPGAQAPVLRPVTLDVAPGSTLALLGPSGSGKSTLLRMLAGLLRPTTGEAVLRLPAEAPAHAHLRAGRVGYIPQHLGLVRSRRVLDNVLAGALARAPLLPSLAGDFPPAERQAALDALEAVGLGAKAHDKVHALSGGERQRVAIARALVQRPALLCADEFVSNLDVANAERVLGLVDGLAEQGVTVVMALHDLGLAKAHAQRIVVLRQGSVARDVAAQDVSAEDLRWMLAA